MNQSGVIHPGLYGTCLAWFPSPLQWIKSLPGVDDDYSTHRYETRLKCRRFPPKDGGTLVLVPWFLWGKSELVPPRRSQMSGRLLLLFCLQNQNMESEYIDGCTVHAMT